MDTTTTTVPGTSGTPHPELSDADLHRIANTQYFKCVSIQNLPGIGLFSGKSTKAAPTHPELSDADLRRIANTQYFKVTNYGFFDRR